MLLKQNKLQLRQNTLKVTSNKNIVECVIGSLHQKRQVSIRVQKFVVNIAISNLTTSVFMA